MLMNTRPLQQGSYLTVLTGCEPNTTSPIGVWSAYFEASILVLWGVAILVFCNLSMGSSERAELAGDVRLGWILILVSSAANTVALPGRKVSHITTKRYTNTAKFDSLI